MRIGKREGIDSKLSFGGGRYDLDKNATRASVKAIDIYVCCQPARRGIISLARIHTHSIR